MTLHRISLSLSSHRRRHCGNCSGAAIRLFFFFGLLGFKILFGLSLKANLGIFHSSLLWHVTFQLTLFFHIYTINNFSHFTFFFVFINSVYDQALNTLYWLVSLSLTWRTWIGKMIKNINCNIYLHIQYGTQLINIGRHWWVNETVFMRIRQCSKAENKFMSFTPFKEYE